MKTYKEMISEVMSSSDLKKIPGGTAAQRKIAQDRQKAREAKNRGFDAAKKPEPAPEKGGALVKAEPAAVKKPDLRKSQIGKWSQGIKANPTGAKKSGDIVKAEPNKPAEADKSVEPVDVKDVTPKKKLKDDNKFLKGMKRQMKSRVGKKALGQKAANALLDVPGKVLGGAKKLAGKAGKSALRGASGNVGVSGDQDLQGLSGRDKGLVG